MTTAHPNSTWYRILYLLLLSHFSSPTLLIQSIFPWPLCRDNPSNTLVSCSPWSAMGPCFTWYYWHILLGHRLHSSSKHVQIILTLFFQFCLLGTVSSVFMQLLIFSLHRLLFLARTTFHSLNSPFLITFFFILHLESILHYHYIL